VDQRVERGVQVQVRALDPVADLLVGEAVSGARGDEQSLREDGGRPAGGPREQVLERLAVQLPLPGAQAAPGGLVDAPRHPGGEPPHGAAARGGPGRGGEPDGDAQTRQVQVGGEDLVPAGPAGHACGQGVAHLGEEPQCQRVPGVVRREGVVGQAVPLTDPGGLPPGQAADPQGVRQPPGGPPGPVQRAGGVERARPFPVLGPAGDDEPDVVRAQPARRRAGPGGEAVREDRWHLLRGVQQDQQGAPPVPGEPGHPRGGGGAHVAGCARAGHDAAGLPQRPGDGVGQGGVVRVQVGAAQPEGRGGRVAARPAVGEGAQGGGAAGAGVADEGEHGRVRGGEGVQLAGDGPALDKAGAGTGAGAARGGGEVEGAGEVQVVAVRGDGGGVAPQQGGQRPVGRGGGGPRERYGEPGSPVPGVQRGAEHSQDGAGRGVQDGAARGRAAQPQRLAALRPDGEFQHVAEQVEPVGGRVGDPGGAEHPCLAPAACGDPYVRTGLDVPAGRDRQGGHSESPGAHERQTGLGQRDDRVALGHSGRAAAGGPRGVAAPALRVQGPLAVLGLPAHHDPYESVHGFVAGQDRALVVGDEADPAGPARRIADPHQRRPFPAFHGPTVGRC
jgi:hypothetical protein